MTKITTSEAMRMAWRCFLALVEKHQLSIYNSIGLPVDMEERPMGDHLLIAMRWNSNGKGNIWFEMLLKGSLDAPDQISAVFRWSDGEKRFNGKDITTLL